MAKLTYEDKISIYEESKQGNSIINISKKYDVNRYRVYHIINLIDKHGFDILRTNKNRKYSSIEKQRIINRVLLNNESIHFVAVDEGLQSFGMLSNWISKYKENGYNIVEQKRGRSPTMKKPKPINKIETNEEKIKRREEENLYLKAELEYSKKLRAVVQARKNQQQKRK